MNGSLLSGVSYGVTRDNVGGHADRIAIREAIAVAGLSGTIWPAGNEPFLNAVSEQLIERVSVFALNARRHLEISGAACIKIADARWKFALPVLNLNLETDLFSVLNKILHARHLQVMTWNRGNEMFTRLGDRVISHLEIESDRGQRVHVCPFGMAYAYLGRFSAEDITP